MGLRETPGPMQPPREGSPEMGVSYEKHLQESPLSHLLGPEDHSQHTAVPVRGRPAQHAGTHPPHTRTLADQTHPGGLVGVRAGRKEKHEAAKREVTQTPSRLRLWARHASWDGKFDAARFGDFARLEPF